MKFSIHLKSNYKNWLYDYLWLTLSIGFIYFLFLGLRPLTVPDEARYSEIPREMVEMGQYLIPHLNYIKYYEKPDLFYWLQSLSIHLFGLSEWAMRFWVCTLGVLGCLVTYWGARRLFNRQTGIYSSLILASSLLYYVLSHLITLDLPVSFFITLTLLSFLIATEEARPLKRRYYMYFSAINAALAVLTKGLIGIAFPIAIIGLWVLLLNEWKLLLKLYLPSTLIIFFIVAAPWHLLMCHADHDWLHFYFFEQQFLRYSTMYADRYKPVYFFIPILLLGMLPWTFFLPKAIRAAWPTWNSRKQMRKEIFLLLWAGFIFLFFSFSHSKLIPYITPLFPPLAILIGKFLAENITQQNIRLRKIMNLFLSGSIICYLSLIPAVNHFYHNSIKQLALELKPQLTPNDIVISYDTYYQDLPFYLERRVVIINWKNELSFGIAHQNINHWIWDDNQLSSYWNSNNHLFLVTNLSYFNSFLIRHPTLKYFVILNDQQNIIISNQQKS